MARETTGSAAGETKGSTEVPVGPASGSTEASEFVRDEHAAQLVDRFALYSGAAGLIPVPFVDMAAVFGVQLQMLRRLSETYGVPFSENRGKSLIASLAGAVIPASAATSTAMGVSSITKGLPGIGTMVGALTMPVVSAGATWVMGKVFMQHFASGGTLLDFNPPDYREFIKSQKAKFAARSASRQAPQPPAATAGSGTATKEAVTTTA
jgi:uncharacterized protein (DUF697 family)